MLVKLKSGTWIDPRRVVMVECTHPDPGEKGAHAHSHVHVRTDVASGGIMGMAGASVTQVCCDSRSEAEEYAAQVADQLNRALGACAVKEAPADVGNDALKLGSAISRMIDLRFGSRDEWPGHVGITVDYQDFAEAVERYRALLKLAGEPV